MKRIIIATTLIAMLFVSGLLSACGQKAAPTLEDLAASDSNIEQTINKEIVRPEGMNVEIVFSGDSFDIIYKFENDMDSADQKILVKAFDANDGELKESWEGALESIEKQTGITGIIGSIIIMNSSGEEIWTRDYPEN